MHQYQDSQYDLNIKHFVAEHFFCFMLKDDFLL